MEWIKVTEKLPEETGVYIVCHLSTDKKRMHQSVETTIFDKKSGKFFLSTQVITLSGTMQVEIKDISHWMQLPEPPKS